MYLSSFAAFEQLSPTGLLLKMKSIDLKLFVVSTYIIYYDLKSRPKSIQSKIIRSVFIRNLRPGTGRFRLRKLW